MSAYYHEITPRSISLGMAVKITDSFTGETPISRPELFLDDKLTKAYGNLQTGYWAISGLGFGTWILVVRARYYFPSEPLKIEIKPGISLEPQGNPRPSEPVVLKPDRRFAVSLHPRPDYPFPEGTMIRGQVTTESDGTGRRIPLPAVVVEAFYRSGRPKTAVSQTTLTDNQGRYDGRYALFLNLDEEKETEVELHFSREGYWSQTISVKMRYGQTRFCNPVLEPLG